MKRTILKITGMSCSHCVNKIETALQDQKGVVKAKINLKKGIAKVKYDETVQILNNLTTAVKEAGYEAEPIN